ncbi:MAG TPA: hypothetical protein PKH65_09355 [Bacteroidia bacterium]|nr:hypothetical protein [Bacteroidia bacterium]HNT80874.1 hypothetical protein [Bacteroidia bacterium]
MEFDFQYDDNLKCLKVKVKGKTDMSFASVFAEQVELHHLKHEIKSYWIDFLEGSPGYSVLEFTKLSLGLQAILSLDSNIPICFVYDPKLYPTNRAIMLQKIFSVKRRAPVHLFTDMNRAKEKVLYYFNEEKPNLI